MELYSQSRSISTIFIPELVRPSTDVVYIQTIRDAPEWRLMFHLTSPPIKSFGLSPGGERDVFVSRLRDLITSHEEATASE